MSDFPLGLVDFLMIVALPAAVALTVLLFARRMKWGGPVAIFGAFVTAFPWRTVTGGFNIFPPREALSWMFFVATGAAIGGLLDGLRRWPASLRVLGVFLFSAIMSSYVFHFKWADDRPILTFAVIGLIATIWWLAMDLLERDEESIVAAPWIFWIVSASSAAICAMFGGLKQGELIGSFAAASGTAIVLSYIFRRRIFIGGASMAFAIPLAMLLCSMHLLADLKPGEFPLLIALAMTPIVIFIARFIPTNSRPRWLRSFIRIAPIALFMAIVLTLSAIKFRQSMQNEDEGESLGRPQTSGSTSIV